MHRDQEVVRGTINLKQCLLSVGTTGENQRCERAGRVCTLVSKGSGHRYNAHRFSPAAPLVPWARFNWISAHWPNCEGFCSVPTERRGRPGRLIGAPAAFLSTTLCVIGASGRRGRGMTWLQQDSLLLLRNACLSYTDSDEKGRKEKKTKEIPSSRTLAESHRFVQSSRRMLFR